MIRRREVRRKFPFSFSSLFFVFLCLLLVWGRLLRNTFEDKAEAPVVDDAPLPPSKSYPGRCCEPPSAGPECHLFCPVGTKTTPSIVCLKGARQSGTTWLELVVATLMREHTKQTGRCRVKVHKAGDAGDYVYSLEDDFLRRIMRFTASAKVNGCFKHDKIARPMGNLVILRDPRDAAPSHFEHRRAHAGADIGDAADAAGRLRWAFLGVELEERGRDVDELFTLMQAFKSSPKSRKGLGSVLVVRYELLRRRKLSPPVIMQIFDYLGLGRCGPLAQATSEKVIKETSMEHMTEAFARSHDGANGTVEDELTGPASAEREDPKTFMALLQSRTRKGRVGSREYYTNETLRMTEEVMARHKFGDLYLRYELPSEGGDVTGQT